MRGLKWHDFLAGVKGCTVCKRYPKVHRGAKAWNGCDPADPRDILDFSKRRILFLSESPPGGRNRTFFWRDEKDRLRGFLFAALNEAEDRRPRSNAFGLDDFIRLNCYLLPSFSYPCSVGPVKTPINTKPDRTMIEHSAREHLARAIDYIKPDDTVLLGESASIVGRTLGFKCYVTYWPTRRTGHWTDTVIPTLRRIIA